MRAALDHGVDLGELQPRHHRDHLGHLGVQTRQHRAGGCPANPKLVIARNCVDQRGVAAMDQPALGDREGLGRVQRIDHRRTARPRRTRAARVDRAERGGGVDHHADPVSRASARRSGRDRSRCRRSHRARRTATRPACLSSSRLLGRRAHRSSRQGRYRPVSGVSPAQSAACAVAAKVKRGHQRERARARLAPHRLADRDHQAERRIADPEARALAAEQLLGRFRLERAQLRGRCC